jgi:nanoRNase/pAp phosphatase (c-di-AMP/oligoRNAs hydrolase)
MTFGGGGHRNACGFTRDGRLDDASRLSLAAIKKALKLKVR